VKRQLQVLCECADARVTTEGPGSGGREPGLYQEAFLRFKRSHRKGLELQVFSNVSFLFFFK
jgi:hypothetical protein